MKLAKIFIALVVLLVLLLFLLRNDQPVSVDLIFARYEMVNVAVVMVFTLGLGILIGFLVALSSILVTKANNRVLRNRNRQLTSELNDLRNVAVDEGLFENGEDEV